MIKLLTQKYESKRQKALPILPVLQGPQRKADQEYLEYNLFTGPHSVATGYLKIWSFAFLVVC